MNKEQIENPKIIGVHTLSEFVYCPRAGVISHEQKHDDSGVDTGFVDLSYSPDYDIGLLKEEITKIVRRLEHFSLGLLGGTLATIVFGMSAKPFLGFLCLLVLVPTAILLAPKLYADLKRYWHIKNQFADYAKQIERTPDLEKRGTELIPWYSLLKSCDVEKCRDLLVDEELGIQGKPWKLLHRGGVTLPVFFCRRPLSAEEGSNDPTAWLKKQHFVRLRAYCRLIEKNTGKHSSCGIIVFAGTLNAVAIKFWRDESADQQLDVALMIARETLKEFEQHDKVGVPQVNTCIRCHLGQPKIYRKEPGIARRNGSDLRPKLHQITVDKKPRTYHSVCGDFFRWTPPHEKAEELKLAELDSPIEEVSELVENSA